MAVNPYAAYKKKTVDTMTPIEIIVKAYDECERQLNRASNFIDIKDHAQAHASLDKACELINTLRSVLDMDVGEISNNLDSLYSFFFKQIIEADVKKDKAIIDNLLPQIRELREAFALLSKLPKGSTGYDIEGMQG